MEIHWQFLFSLSLFLFLSQSFVIMRDVGHLSLLVAWSLGPVLVGAGDPNQNYILGVKSKDYKIEKMNIY